MRKIKLVAGPLAGTTLNLEHGDSLTITASSDGSRNIYKPATPPVMSDGFELWYFSGTQGES